MTIKSLCASCLNGFKCEIENTSNKNSNKIKVRCLEYPEVFDNLATGMYKHTDPFPYIKKCTHYSERKNKK